MSFPNLCQGSLASRILGAIYINQRVSPSHLVDSPSEIPRLTVWNCHQATSNFPRLPFLNQTLWKLTEKNDLWDWNVAKDYPETYMDIKHKDKADFPITLVEWALNACTQFLARLIQIALLCEVLGGGFFLGILCEWQGCQSRGTILRTIRKFRWWSGFRNEPDNGKGVLWSSIRETAAYKNRESPFVIVIALSRSSSHQPLSIESPICTLTWHRCLPVASNVCCLGQGRFPGLSGSKMLIYVVIPFLQFKTSSRRKISPYGIRVWTPLYQSNFLAHLGRPGSVLIVSVLRGSTTRGELHSTQLL